MYIQTVILSIFCVFDAKIDKINIYSLQSILTIQYISHFKMGIIESAEEWNNDTHDDADAMYTRETRYYSSRNNIARPGIPLCTSDRRQLGRHTNNDSLSGQENFAELVKKYENCKNQDIKNTIIETMSFLADNPGEYYTNYVDKKGITLLTALICCKLSNIILKLLPYIEKFKPVQVTCDMSFRPLNPYNNTELMIAIRKRLDDVAIAMLSFPSVCKINNTNISGDTALIVAIKMKSTNIIKEILKYCDQFDINHKNKAGETALTIAKTLNLDVITDIEQCM